MIGREKDVVDGGTEVNGVPRAWLCPGRYGNRNGNNVKERLELSKSCSQCRAWLFSAQVGLSSANSWPPDQDISSDPAAEASDCATNL